VKIKVQEVLLEGGNDFYLKGSVTLNCKVHLIRIAVEPEIDCH
jgi:hypothetical protein